MSKAKKPSTSSVEPPDDPARTKRRAGRVRRRIIVGAFLLSLPVLLVLLVTRSPVTARIVTPVLSSLTGAQVRIKSATIGLDGSATLRGVAATAPGVSGPAATFVEVERIDAAFSWTDVLRGRGVRSITLLEPRLRASQSTETQLLNISGLTLLRPSTTTGTPLPTIIIDDASLEIGEHTDGTYQALSVLHFDGSIIPDPASPGRASTIRITTLAPDGPILGVPGQDITGRIDKDAVTITPAELSLTSLRPSTLPAAARRELELLDLKGRLRLRSFNYTFASGRVEAEVLLSGVEMNLPVQAAEKDEPGTPLRLTEVNGTIGLRSDRIRANLRGKVADLPYTVRMDYMGSTADAPFTCELATDGYQVSARPDLLPFAPAVVRERMAAFSNPTATVISHVTVTREPPTADSRPSPVRVRGTLDFRDGEASYFEFPYIFRQMTGSVTFDDEKIVLNSIEGVADSGAKIHVTGTIAPPNELATVDIVARVTDVPVDEAIADAMGPERREVITALFSRTRQRELVESGLILGEAEAAHLRADLDRLRAMPSRSPEAEARLVAVEQTLAQTPTFDAGGRGDVMVRVTRPYGHLTPWHTDIIVSFVSLGVLPEAFPLPIVASDVRLHITDDRAVLERGTYRTPRGGLATVDCTVDLFAPDGTRDFIPHISIVAGAIPVDDLLIHAIPDGTSAGAIEGARGGGEGGTAPAQVSARDALTALDLDGAIDIRAAIEPRGDGTLGYTVNADVPGLSAAPAGFTGGPSLLLRDMKGTLRVSDQGLVADLSTELRALGAGAEDASDATDAGRATLALDAPFGGSGATTARAVVVGLDAGAPIEDAIRPIAPEAAARLAALRAAHAPSGRLDAEVDVRVQRGAASGTIAVGAIRDASFDALDGRASLSVVEGRVIADIGTPATGAEDAGGSTIRFEEFAAAIDHDGSPMGRVELSGDLRLGARGVEAAGTDVRMEWLDAPLNSAAIRSLLRQSLGDAAHSVYTEHDPIGRFDLDLRLAPASGPGLSDEQSLGAWGSLHPRGISVLRYGERIAFPGSSGAIRFNPGGGSFDHLTLDAPGLSLSIDGSWHLPAGAKPNLDVVISGWADAQGSKVKALLPARLHDMAEAAQLSVDGEMRVEDLRLSVEGDPRGSDALIRASGAISVDQASMRLGLPITNLSGVIRFLAGAEPGSTTFDVGLMSPSLDLANLRITDARVRIASDPSDPRIIAPLISGATHGGRLSGRATIGPSVTDPEVREFFASLHVAGARFASVLADLSLRPDSGQSGSEATDGLDASRGLLDAELSLRGTVGRHETTVGRGELAVSGGEVLSLPLLLPILQVTSLQVPTAENLDLALASFHVSQGRVVFEEMSVFSRSIELFGYGTMTWPGTELDLRVVSRAARAWPIVSSIVEVVRNELISVRVDGTLTEPTSVCRSSRACVG
jgi:hypothetical protein